MPYRPLSKIFLMWSGRLSIEVWLLRMVSNCFLWKFIRACCSCKVSLNFLLNAASGSFRTSFSDIQCGLTIDYLGASKTDLDFTRRACTISFKAMWIVFLLSGDTLDAPCEFGSKPGVSLSLLIELFLLNCLIIFPIRVSSCSSSSSSSFWSLSIPNFFLFSLSYLWRILWSLGFLLGALLMSPLPSSRFGWAFFNLLSLNRNSFDLLKTPSRILVAGDFCSYCAS